MPASHAESMSVSAVETPPRDAAAELYASCTYYLAPLLSGAVWSVLGLGLPSRHYGYHWFGQCAVLARLLRGDRARRQPTAQCDSGRHPTIRKVTYVLCDSTP